MADSWLDLHWKNYALFVVSLLVFFGGTDVLPLLSNLGVPPWVLVKLDAVSRLLALLIAWLGYSPLKTNPLGRK